MILFLQVKSSKKPQPKTDFAQVVQSALTIQRAFRRYKLKKRTQPTKPKVLKKRKPSITKQAKVIKKLFQRIIQVFNSSFI